jgi:hypothetical protein
MTARLGTTKGCIEGWTSMIEGANTSASGVKEYFINF